MGAEVQKEANKRPAKKKSKRKKKKEGKNKRRLYALSHFLSPFFLQNISTQAFAFRAKGVAFNAPFSSSRFPRLLTGASSYVVSRKRRVRELARLPSRYRTPASIRIAPPAAAAALSWEKKKSSKQKKELFLSSAVHGGEEPSRTALCSAFCRSQDHRTPPVACRKPASIVIREAKELGTRSRRRIEPLFFCRRSLFFFFQLRVSSGAPGSFFAASSRGGSD